MHAPDAVRMIEVFPANEAETRAVEGRRRAVDVAMTGAARFVAAPRARRCTIGRVLRAHGAVGRVEAVETTCRAVLTERDALLAEHPLRTVTDVDVTLRAAGRRNGTIRREHTVLAALVRNTDGACP